MHATSSQTTSGNSASESSSAPADDGLTGFGATWDTWDATRAPDNNAAINMGHNTGYSPDADLPVTNGTAHDRYSVVQGTDTYVTSYQVNFRPHTTIAEALAAILQNELPADTTWAWKAQVPDGCYFAQAHSVAFAKTAAAVGIGDGTGLVEVEFRSLPEGGQLGYDPDNVTFATLNWPVDKTPADLGGC